MTLREPPVAGSWRLGRMTLPHSLRGLGEGIGAVTFVQGHLLVAAGGNVYALRLETEQGHVEVRYHLLGPLGKVDVGFQGAER